MAANYLSFLDYLKYIVSGHQIVGMDDRAKIMEELNEFVRKQDEQRTKLYKRLMGKHGDSDDAQGQKVDTE